MSRIGIFEIATGELASWYEADAPNPAVFGGDWGDAAKFEHRAAPVPTEEVRAASIQAVKSAGFSHVTQAFPVYTVARLAFRASTDTDRKACGALIEAVKARVNAAEATILAAADTAAMDKERGAALADIAAL